MKLSDIENHLKKFTVGIAGAGGLGSNCAVALARSGIGTLVIADFDIVEASNLSRQYYFIDQIGVEKTFALKENLIRIRPDIKVIPHQTLLDSNNIVSIFEGCDVVVEAFDRPDMKEMLLESLQQEVPYIPLIIGSGVAGWGNSNILKMRKLDESLVVCGDELSEVSDNYPPLAPRVGIVANMQANAVLEILLKKI